MRWTRQWCGLARALDVLGERWALLIVRDLLLGPKRYGELENGLPGVPSNVLTARLRELEDTGVIRRSVAPRPGSGTVYELTDEGRELEPILLRLGLWGSRGPISTGWRFTRGSPDAASPSPQDGQPTRT